MSYQQTLLWRTGDISSATPPYTCVLQHLPTASLTPSLPTDHPQPGSPVSPVPLNLFPPQPIPAGGRRACVLKLAAL